MKKLLLLLSLISLNAFATDRGVPCNSNSCSVKIVTKDSGGNDVTSLTATSSLVTSNKNFAWQVDNTGGGAGLTGTLKCKVVQGNTGASTSASVAHGISSLTSVIVSITGVRYGAATNMMQLSTCSGSNLTGICGYDNTNVTVYNGYAAGTNWSVLICYLN